MAHGETRAAVQASEKLPLSVKIAFGAPGFAGAAMGVAMSVLLPRFYSDVVLAPLGTIAIAIAAARAFDALTDPFVGWISDQARTRWGRRKPFIAVGGPFVALTFYALFSPPHWLTPGQASLWFAISFTLCFLFSAVVQISYGALGAELTFDYRERSSLFGYRSMFLASGMIAGALVPVVLTSYVGISDERTVHRLVSSGYAALLIILGVVLLLRVSERPEFVARESNPLVPGVRRALRNRPFRILLLAGIVSAVPAAIPAILMPYFVQYVLQPENPSVWVGLFLGLYLGCGLLFVPWWMFVAARIGKLRALVIASSIGIVGSVFYFFAGPGDLVFAGAIYLLTGTQAMAGSFLVPAMVADVIDYDELRTGKRREAQYTAFLNLVPKFVAIPGASIPLAILAAVGYVPNQAQSQEVLFWIRFMYSLFPASFYVMALLIVSRYPISEAMHRKIRSGIVAHGNGASAVDPLSGMVLPPSGGSKVRETDGWFLDHFGGRELRRALNGGAGGLVMSVAAGMVASLLVCLVASLVVMEGLRNPDSPPGPTTVIAVVIAGLAVTLFLFHCLRLAPARRMAVAPLPDEVVRAHLEEQVGMRLAPGPSSGRGENRQPL